MSGLDHIHLAYQKLHFVRLDLRCDAGQRTCLLASLSHAYIGDIHVGLEQSVYDFRVPGMYCYVMQADVFTTSIYQFVAQPLSLRYPRLS